MLMLFLTIRLNIFAIKIQRAELCGWDGLYSAVAEPLGLRQEGLGFCGGDKSFAAVGRHRRTVVLGATGLWPDGGGVSATCGFALCCSTVPSWIGSFILWRKWNTKGDPAKALLWINSSGRLMKPKRVSAQNTLRESAKCLTLTVYTLDINSVTWHKIVLKMRYPFFNFDRYDKRMGLKGLRFCEKGGYFNCEL